MKGAQGMSKKTIEEESWNRYPDARFRMREGGLKTLLEGLGEDGYCFIDKPRIHVLDDGIYIEIPTNTGKHGDIVSLPLEIFIPADTEPPKKKKKKAEVEVIEVVAEPEVVTPEVEVVPVESEE
jgi:hypothetical protein